MNTTSSTWFGSTVLYAHWLQYKSFSDSQTIFSCCLLLYLSSPLKGLSKVTYVPYISRRPHYCVVSPACDPLHLSPVLQSNQHNKIAPAFRYEHLGDCSPESPNHLGKYLEGQVPWHKTTPRRMREEFESSTYN